MKSTDTLGRATFHHIPPRTVSRLTARENQWLQHINRHGPQSSDYLHELTKATHKNRRCTGNELRKLRAANILRLPRQQRATEAADFNHYIYDIGPKGRELTDLPETVTPRGHWVHQFMTACITSSIDIMARRNGAEYIPAHQILNLKGATLEADINGRKLIPDQLFALKVNGLYRAFSLEADRGTEPTETSTGRKSHSRNIQDYIEFIGTKKYKDHYGLRAGMLLLYVFSNRAKMRRFQEQVARITNGRCSYILTQHIENFDYFFKPPRLLKELFDGPWERVGSENFCIDT